MVNPLKQGILQKTLGKFTFIGFMILLFILVLSRIFTPFPEKQKAITETRDNASVHTEVIENYEGFKIIRHGDDYYAIALAMAVDLADKQALAACQANYQCIVGSSSEEVKLLVDVLAPGLVKSIATSSSHRYGGPARLFDNHSYPDNPWYGEAEYPQWIHITFSQPVVLKWLGLQAQTGGVDERGRAPHNVRVLGGHDFEVTQYKTDLTFYFDGAGQWSFQELPGSGEKFEQYRILLMDNQGQTDFVTIQEMRFLVLVEENYKGFNIFWNYGKFYVLAQDLVALELVKFQETNPDLFQTNCTVSRKCGLADSLEEAKRLADQLN